MTFNVYKQIAPNRYREDFGLYFEDFKPGLIIEHRPGRTITGYDNIAMTLLTMNPSQIHFDAHYCEKTEFGKPLVNSTITLAIITGLSVNTMSKKVVANLEWDNVKLHKPVFEGDTLYAESEVLSKRESASRPTQGILTMASRGFNQHNELVISFTRTVLIYKRDGAPEYGI